ncbi:hypothetical protein Tco_1508248 [Tanacetum coccineum]
MHTRAAKYELVELLPEPERTLNQRLHRRNKRVPFNQRNNPPQNPRIVYSLILNINYFRHFLVILENLYPMDDEPMWAADLLTVEITQEVLNAATGGIFLYKTPNQAYRLLEDKVLLKLDWGKNQKTKSSLKKTIAFADKDLLTSNLDRPSGSLPSNTQPNPKGHNSKAYQPPQSCNEHVNDVFTRSGKSYNPPINRNDQQDNSETPVNFNSDDEDEPTP